MTLWQTQRQVVVRGRSGPRKCRPRSRVTGRAREERAGAEEREDGSVQPRWRDLATAPAATCSLRGARQERLTRCGQGQRPPRRARATSKTRSDNASGTMSTTPKSTQKRRNDGQATRALSQSPGRSVLPTQHPVHSSWADSEWTVQVESIRGTSRLSRRPPRARSQSAAMVRLATAW
jgi:hypothetical protein